MGAKIRFVAPEYFMPKNIQDFDVEYFDNLEKGIDSSDVVMMLRIQKERIDNIDDYDLNDYIHSFQLTNQILEKTASDFLAIHPMPMNIGVEISKEASENSKFKYIEQLSFGVPSRIASYLYGLGEI